MEAFVIREQNHSMSTQEFVLQLQQTMDHLQKIEQLLDDKVRREIDSLMNKHAHIQNEINE